MRISFDLDDTLILTREQCVYENPLPLPWRLFYHEQLRRGTVALCRELKSLGYDICVYTTSERSVSYIKKLFSLYGISLSQVINQSVHQRVVQGSRKEVMPSKVPSRFGIDLHIDDDMSVKNNGVAHGFRVLIINRRDEEWTQKVLDEAKRVAVLKNA